MNYEHNPQGKDATRTNLDGTAVKPFSSNLVAGLELRSILGSITRQYKLILLIALLVAVLTLAALSQLTSRYTAEALLVIDERESQLVGLDETFSNVAALSNFVDTEVQILNSSAVLLGVVRRLSLWNDEEFGFRPSLLNRLFAISGVKITQSDVTNVTRFDQIPGGSQTELTAILAKSLKITRVGLTSVISVRATSRSPEKAAQVANSVLESYFDVQIDARVKTAQRAANFLEQRVDELAKTIQDVDNRLDTFVLEQSGRVGPTEVREEVGRMRAEIRNAIVTQGDLALGLAQLQQLKSSDGNPPASALRHLNTELRALVEERARLLREAQSSNDQSTVREQLSAMEQQITIKLNAQIGDLSRAISSYDDKVTALRKAVVELFARQQVPSEVALQLYRLQRESENSRRLYDSYSQRLGEVQQKANLALPNSRVVASAVVPHSPSFPPIRLILAAMLVGGLGLGCVGAVIREHLIGGFASSDQLEAVTNCPVLSVIPSYNHKDPHNAIIRNPLSGFSESIRRLRFNLDSLIRSGRSSVIVVTSSEPHEGKSTIAISLARAYATAGQETLLIDGDLRRASIGHLMGMSSPVDLFDLLMSLPNGKVGIPSAFGHERETGVRLLSMTPINEISGDYIFDSYQFEQLIDYARDAFNVIIIDSPPVGYVVDSKVISRLSDVCLYVVRQNGASQRDVMIGIRESRISLGVRPIGLVLNGVKPIFGYYSSLGKRYNDYYTEQ